MKKSYAPDFGEFEHVLFIAVVIATVVFLRH